MNLNDLKNYASEIAFGVLFSILLAWYGIVYYQYDAVWSQESRMTQLQSQFDITQLQIEELTDATDEELENWQQMQQAFLARYPAEAPFPREVVYNAIDRTYLGEQIPIESHALFIYGLIYDIAEELFIDQIKISVDPQAKVNIPKEMSDFVDSAVLDFEFRSQYKHALQFIEKITAMPVVFRLISIKMERSDTGARSAATLMRIRVQYLYRKEGLSLE